MSRKKKRKGHGRKPGPAPGSLRKRIDAEAVTNYWLAAYFKTPLRPIGSDRPESWTPAVSNR